MMTPELRDKIKKVIGSHYVEKINKMLEKKGIRAYSQPYISNVFSGKENNLDIETCILELYSKKLKEKNANSKRLLEISQKEKPEAVTPGSDSN